jgi:hypothetical protein
MGTAARILCLSLQTLVLFVIFPNPTGGERVGREGEVWLKMGSETRNTYAVAYVLGFSAGFERGCSQGTKGIHATLPGPENDPTHICRQQELQFPNTDSLAMSVTNFYRKYPDNRYLSITDVMNAFGSGMSAEEIHKHASPIGVTQSH